MTWSRYADKCGWDYRYVLAAGALAALSTSAMARSGQAEPLKLGFVIRPGMAEMIDGVPKGTYLPLAAAIAREAHLNVTIDMLPQLRLIEQVRSNTPNYCAIGVYQTPERLAYAKFSRAFFLDKPLVVLTMKNRVAEVRQHATFAALAADTSLKIGLLDGFSYGPRLDAVIGKMNGNVDRIAGTAMQNLSKLVLGRFDYTIASSEEAPRGVEGTSISTKDLVQIAFPDMAPGAARHFMCSMAVDDAVIRRLNAAIQSLHLEVE